MQQHPRIVVWIAIAIVGLVVGVMHSAEASFQLKLTTGGGSSITITDDVFGDSAWGVAGVIAYSGVLGNFNVNVTTGVSKPFLSASTPTLTINSLNATSSTADSLTIILTDTGFAGSPTTFETLISGTLISPLAPSRLTARSFLDDADVEFATTTSLGNVGPLSGPNAINVVNGSALGSASPTGPFSMTLSTTIEHNGAGSTTGFSATVHSVPESSASLCLGMALFGLAGYGWWSRKQNKVQ
jgi:hypothetical protein